MKKGIFITLEGADGAGKTTQVALLKQYFEDNKIDAMFLREPGATSIGEKIRQILIDKNNVEMADYTEAYLYAAARAQLVCEVIKPAILAGKIVVCDRFLDSSVAYQGFARGMGEDTILNINQFAVEGIAPDITFFIKLEPEIGFSRKDSPKNYDRLEEAGLQFHKKVYEGYIKLAEKHTDRIIVINGGLSKKKVHAKIISILERNGCI